MFKYWNPLAGGCRTRSRHPPPVHPSRSRLKNMPVKLGNGNALMQSVSRAGESLKRKYPRLVGSESRFKSLRKMEAIAVGMKLGGLVQLSNFHDEPKFFRFVGRPADDNKLGFGGAISLDETRARIKALGEMFERISMVEARKTVVRESYDKLKKSAEAMNPLEFDDFTPEQRKHPWFARYNYDEKSVLRWVKGFELQTGREILVPQQLVEFSLPPKNEAIIRITTSSGTAGWPDSRGAILRGILELIERDAIMTSWFKGKKLNRIAISGFPEDVVELCRILDKYQIRLELFDATSDIPIPVVVAVLTDCAAHPTCYISFGSKASATWEEAAVGAIEEGMMIRLYMKERILSGESSGEVQHALKTPEDRMMYWGVRRRARGELNFFLGGKHDCPLQVRNLDGHTNEEILNEVLSLLRKKGLEGAFVPLAAPEMERAGYHVARILLPSLVPIYFDARYPPLGRGRLSLGPGASIPARVDNGSTNHPFA